MTSLTQHHYKNLLRLFEVSRVRSIGESVEENANLVVRLLIRRPECLGPALRGEGGGLLKALMGGITMSLQIAAFKNPNAVQFIRAVSETEDDDRGNFLSQR